ncbi:MAG: hypothetical protein J2P34_04940 [Actinobacteria bacterium]|nr:hypothetical protein [Actinomycetota bacterium]
MRSQAGEGQRGAALAADHAGSVLCRLLMDHPDVVDIEILGQAEIIEGTISYSLGVFLPDGRELYIDVEDAPVHLPPRRPRRNSRAARATGPRLRTGP